MVAERPGISSVRRFVWIERNLSVEEITAIYIKEISEGVGDSGIRAGAVKIATGAHRISDYERKLVQAGARAAPETGVPLISYTQEASCGHDQIDLVTGEGVAAGRLVVGHSDGIDDHEYTERSPSVGRSSASTASASRSSSPRGYWRCCRIGGRPLF